MDRLRPIVVSNPHPLIGDGREYAYEFPKEGETLGNYILRVGIDIPKGSLTVHINGLKVSNELWPGYLLQGNDTVVFAATATGGGGSGGKVLRLVAMIGIAVFAAWAAPTLAGALGFAGSDLAIGAIGAVINIAGSMLVNALLPPPKPQTPDMHDKKHSPTYGINAGRNQINPYGPMTVVFGRHKLVPFLGSKPYVDFDGETQYLNQVFHLGLQENLLVKEVRIGDTLLSNYKEVNEEYSNNGLLKLFPTNVDALDPFDVSHATSVIRTTPKKTFKFIVDFVASLYSIGNDGSENSVSVNMKVRWKKSGSSEWLRDNEHIVRLSGSSPRNPTRYSIAVDVESGSYDIEVSKLYKDVSSSRASNKVSVTQIRCIQEDDTDYRDQLRYGLRVQATAQLNGAIDELNMDVSAQCPVWNGQTWIVSETSNPAWWYLYWAKGARRADGKRLFGECLPENRIDVDGIKEWALFCERKKLQFNWVLDRQMSIEEVYYTIARAGRASSTWQTGKRGVVFDDDQLPITTLLTPENIVADSFSYTSINSEFADEIIVNFYNELNGYEKDSVRQKVPNSPITNNPITLDLEGCTNADQAGREANLLAASQLYHRRQYSFEMDVEGAILRRGDVALLTHDLTSFTQTGRLTKIVGFDQKDSDLDGIMFGLDNDKFITGSQWLIVRSPENKIYSIKVTPDKFGRPIVNGKDGNPYYEIVKDWNSVLDASDWIYSLSPEPLNKKIQIKSVVPQTNGNFKYEAIDYVKAYYESENDPYVHAPRLENKVFQTIKVLDVSAYETVTDSINGIVQTTFKWVLSEAGNVHVKATVNGATYYDDSAYNNQLILNVKKGDEIKLIIEPSAHIRLGETKEFTYTVVGVNWNAQRPQNLKLIKPFEGQEVSVKWDSVLHASGYELHIVEGSTIKRSIKLGDVFFVRIYE